MPTVSLEDRAVRDALRAKAIDVKEQLNQARSTRQVVHLQWGMLLCMLETKILAQEEKDSFNITLSISSLVSGLQWKSGRKT